MWGVGQWTPRRRGRDAYLGPKRHVSEGKVQVRERKWAFTVLGLKWWYALI